jgi:hypothetical protein
MKCQSHRVKEFCCDKRRHGCTPFRCTTVFFTKSRRKDLPVRFRRLAVSRGTCGAEVYLSCSSRCNEGIRVLLPGASTETLLLTKALRVLQIAGISNFRRCQFHGQSSTQTSACLLCAETLIIATNCWSRRSFLPCLNHLYVKFSIE